MSFELTFLGCSGGPLESGTCSLLIKPAEITYMQILELGTSPVICIDAGSGLLSLASIIADADSVKRRHLLLYADSLGPDRYTKLTQTKPFDGLSQTLLAKNLTLLTAIFGISNIFLTHPHLDHISGFVLNLPFYACPLATAPCLYGSDFTMDVLRKHIFNGMVWPDLEKSGVIALESVKPKKTVHMDSFAVTMLELSHGHFENGTLYPSLAYLVRHNVSGRQIAVFGDFESDQVLGSTRNLEVWTQLAPSIDSGSLDTIVVECLTPSPEAKTELYGHLIPEHLVDELEVLAKLCPSRPQLNGLNVIINHVKDMPGACDPRLRILREVEELSRKRNLTIHLSMALNGMLLIV